MNVVKKLGAVFFYLIIISVLLDFQMNKLFDLKQFCMVIIGILILYIPEFRFGQKPDLKTIGKCSLIAGYIQTFVLLFILLSNADNMSNVLPQVALSCRPILYGFCIWSILIEDRKVIHTKENQEMQEEKKAFTATESYYIFRELGLTNREAEVAVQVCRGMSNGEIAAELKISETTVKKHISNIFEKLNISKRDQIREKLQ